MTAREDVAPGYTLVVCEKPDVAKKVAASLSSGSVRSLRMGGVEALECENGAERYVICSAAGHLYGVSDSFKGREVYPVFDVEWFPANLVDKDAKRLGNRIRVIERLAGGASRLVNACDYDAEGETIGHNILTYACGGRAEEALRAKFSTLTSEELSSSIRAAEPSAAARRLAVAGRTRHTLDFIWGINLSRALSSSFSASNSGYRTISMGRVQGPTLAFVVERETQVRLFVPTPYWTIKGIFAKKGKEFEAPLARQKISLRADALSIERHCEGKAAEVSELVKSVFKEPAPPPFDIGDLQKEAYRVFGYSPSRTLQLAEKLYLRALISYPRTGSQKLPSTIGYSGILSGLSGLGEYASLVEELRSGALVPREGGKEDRAHPAIHPTGEHPRGFLDSQSMRLYDLIVRRFLACFAKDAVRERVTAKIMVDGEEFRLIGRRTLKLGWLRFYSRYTGVEDRWIPSLVEGDALTVVKVKSEERFETPPPRYNQSSLLERMEKEGVGTKATRADTISTLISRGYVSKEGLSATDLGLSVVETMEEFSPQSISTTLTRETEIALESIEKGDEDEGGVIERVIDIFSKQIELLKVNELGIGTEIGRSAIETTLSQVTIGDCPVCKQGKLRIIRSRKTGKRFVGCTGYSKGCRASAPLPQRGTVRSSGKVCSHCGWPIVYVRFGRRYPWRLCVNAACVSKEKGESRKSAVQTLQENR